MFSSKAVRGSDLTFLQYLNAIVVLGIILQIELDVGQTPQLLEAIQRLDIQNTGNSEIWKFNAKIRAHRKQWLKLNLSNELEF